MNENDGYLGVMIAFANRLDHLSLPFHGSISYFTRNLEGHSDDSSTPGPRMSLAAVSFFMLNSTRFSHDDVSVRILVNETHRYYPNIVCVWLSLD